MSGSSGGYGSPYGGGMGGYGASTGGMQNMGYQGGYPGQYGGGFGGMGQYGGYGQYNPMSRVNAYGGFNPSQAQQQSQSPANVAPNAYTDQVGSTMSPDLSQSPANPALSSDTAAPALSYSRSLMSGSPANPVGGYLPSPTSADTTAAATQQAANFNGGPMSGYGGYGQGGRFGWGGQGGRFGYGQQSPINPSLSPVNQPQPLQSFSPAPPLQPQPVQSTPSMPQPPQAVPQQVPQQVQQPRPVDPMAAYTKQYNALLNAGQYQQANQLAMPGQTSSIPDNGYGYGTPGGYQFDTAPSTLDPNSMNFLLNWMGGTVNGQNPQQQSQQYLETYRQRYPNGVPGINNPTTPNTNYLTGVRF